MTALDGNNITNSNARIHHVWLLQLHCILVTVDTTLNGDWDYELDDVGCSTVADAAAVVV